jgi:hypothetical protein
MQFFPPVTVEELRRLSDEEVVKRINANIAPSRDNPTFFSMPDFVSAQFYMAELDRREKKRADQERDEIEAKRWRTDLNYERWIVFLIILEVIVAAVLTLWADHRQSKSSEKELAALQSMQQVLSRLEESSAATAGTLTALQETSKQMNEAVQKELAFSYEVSLNVKFDITSDQIIITNEGRTRVSLWGCKVGKSGIVMQKAPRTLTPGVPYLITGHEVTTGLTGIVPKGGFAPIPFVMFIKNERGEEFVARYEFAQMTMMGPMQIQPIMVSITQFEWSKKR